MRPKGDIQKDEVVFIVPALLDTLEALVEGRDVG